MIAQTLSDVWGSLPQELLLEAIKASLIWVIATLCARKRRRRKSKKAQRQRKRR
jgi:hypothetical protein